MMNENPATSVEAARKYHAKHGDMDGHTCLLARCALHYPESPVSPVTTVFDASKDPSKIKKKIIRGIVRHCKISGSRHQHYPELFTDPTDLSHHEIKWLRDLIWDFPDGEEVEIVVTSKGESPCAHGFVWMLTGPLTSERVPEEEWRKTLPKEAKGCPHDIPVHLRGKANVCLAGGPKTEEYPGGQFCSHLETVGKCKLDIEEAEG